MTAIVAASLDLGWLNQFIAQIPLPEGVTVVLFDRKGTVLTRHPDPEGLVGRSLPEAAMTRAIMTGKEGVMEWPGLDGMESVIGFTTLSPQLGGIHIAVTIPRKIIDTKAGWQLID